MEISNLNFPIEKILMAQIHLALIHYPVLDKNKDVVSTSITNFDIHDISRSARTFGVKTFYIVTPTLSQHEFAQRIIEHWEKGYGSVYNPNRKEALELVKIKSDLFEVFEDIEKMSGSQPITIGTSAKTHYKSITFKNLYELCKKDVDICLIFGTGWGIDETLMADFDYILEPIKGVGDYNHLSVRSAVAIILDRISQNKA